MNSRKGINAIVILSSKFLVSKWVSSKRTQKTSGEDMTKGFHKTKNGTTNDSATPFLGV